MAMHENVGDEGSLTDHVKMLPGNFVVIADAAYEATEKVVSMYYGVQHQNVLHDNFNYAASCCRIQIEQAFGHMTNKWRILHRPLCNHLHNVKLVAIAIACLHNFCIREKLESDSLGDDRSYEFVAGSNNNATYYTSVPNMFDVMHPMPNADEPKDLYKIPGSSMIRDAMVAVVEECKEEHPSTSVLYRHCHNTLVVQDSN